MPYRRGWRSTSPWLTHGIAGIFMIAAVGLVCLLAVQTTKQEGLDAERSAAGWSRPIAAGSVPKSSSSAVTGGVAVVFVVTALRSLADRNLGRGVSDAVPLLEVQNLRTMFRTEDGPVTQ